MQNEQIAWCPRMKLFSMPNKDRQVFNPCLSSLSRYVGGYDLNKLDKVKRAVEFYSEFRLTLGN
jgi:hypothetical protein